MPCSHAHLIWEEIDISNLEQNIKNLKKIIHKNTKFMAVIKADAYGHGAVEIAKASLKSGADMFGVARIDEAIRLRHSNINAPMLIFGRTP